MASSWRSRTDDWIEIYEIGFETTGAPEAVKIVRPFPFLVIEISFADPAQNGVFVPRSNTVDALGLNVSVRSSQNDFVAAQLDVHGMGNPRRVKDLIRQAQTACAAQVHNRRLHSEVISERLPTNSAPHRRPNSRSMSASLSST